MSERPIGESADDLAGVRDDDVPRAMDEVVDLVRGDLDAVRRLVNKARAGHGHDLDAELGAVAAVMQRELRQLGSEVQHAFTTVVDELDELRRPTAEGQAPSTPARSLDEAELHVSSSSPDHHDVLAHPPPNSVIVVDESVVYTTDELGRVVRAQAELTAIQPEQPRNRRAERTVRGRLPGDHAGHIIARILGGVGDSINLVPMEARRVNLGQYRTLERRWQRAVKRGQQVVVDIQLLYEDDGQRPVSLYVCYDIDGERQEFDIKNAPATGESDES